MRVALADLFAGKTWAFLMDTLALSERAAKHRMAGTRAFTLDEAFELLARDDGYRLLAKLMAAVPDPKPAWWLLVEPLMGLVDAQQLQIAARRQIERTLEKTIDADRDLTATLARGQAALLHSDPEFYGARLAPMGRLAGALEAGAGLEDRAVAAAAPRRG